MRDRLGKFVKRTPPPQPVFAPRPVYAAPMVQVPAYPPIEVHEFIPSEWQLNYCMNCNRPQVGEWHLKAEPKPNVIYEGFSIPETTILMMKGRIKDWLASCCGLSGDKELEVGSYGGMGAIKTVEDAIAMRIAAYRGPGTYRTGYIIASSTNRQTNITLELMEKAGFKLLDTYVNPAHGSGAVMSIWGAKSIPM